LTAELDAVVSRFKEAHEELHIVRLPQNQGLGLALKEGLTHCHYDIVARMDSDDISKPQRFSREMTWLETHPETDIVGCWTDEFADESGKVISTRRLPENHEALLQFSRYRNPMNHPTVMFRKAAVMEAGNYQHCELFEDYDLWARMIQQGYRFHNLPVSLLWFRLTDQPFSQRGGFGYIAKELHFQRHLHEKGYISLGRMGLNMLMRTLVRLVPWWWRKYSYLFLIR
jgi:glycosyltransferase involved in cell wall biosynthesis